MVSVKDITLKDLFLKSDTQGRGFGMETSLAIGDLAMMSVSCAVFASEAKSFVNQISTKMRDFQSYRHHSSLVNRSICAS